MPCRWMSSGGRWGCRLESCLPRWAWLGPADMTLHEPVERWGGLYDLASALNYEVCPHQSPFLFASGLRQLSIRCHLVACNISASLRGRGWARKGTSASLLTRLGFKAFTFRFG